MFSHLQEEEYNKWKLQAALVGVDVEKAKQETKKTDSFTFKDPSEYANLTKEQKKELTDKMMGRHRQWASGAIKEKKGA